MNTEETLNSETKNLLKINSSKLNNVSPERIKTEVLKIVNASWGNSVWPTFLELQLLNNWQADEKLLMPKVLQNDVTPAFMIDLAFKDLGIALELGNETNVPLGLGGASKGSYEVAQEEGRGKQDWTSIFLSLQSRSGMSLPDKIKE